MQPPLFQICSLLVVGEISQWQKMMCHVELTKYIFISHLSENVVSISLVWLLLA